MPGFWGRWMGTWAVLIRLSGYIRQKARETLNTFPIVGEIGVSTFLLLRKSSPGKLKLNLESWNTLMWNSVVTVVFPDWTNACHTVNVPYPKGANNVVMFEIPSVSTWIVCRDRLCLYVCFKYNRFCHSRNSKILQLQNIYLLALHLKPICQFPRTTNLGHAQQSTPLIGSNTYHQLGIQSAGRNRHYWKGCIISTKQIIASFVFAIDTTMALWLKFKVCIWFPNVPPVASCLFCV